MYRQNEVKCNNKANRSKKLSFLIGRPPHSPPPTLRRRLPPNLINRPLQRRLDGSLAKALDIKVRRRDILIVQISHEKEQIKR